MGEYGRANVEGGAEDNTEGDVDYRWYFGPLGVMGPIPATAPFI